ncbi:Pentatricopeptide repeat - like 10 [Theobroma cacao]|nr:Pentatricopeptide repeat - like 10 [Theobroma cacao]
MMRGWRSVSLSSSSSSSPFVLLQQLELGNHKSAYFHPFLLLNSFSVLNKIRALFYFHNSHFSTSHCKKSEYNEALSHRCFSHYPPVYTLSIMLNCFCRLHRVDFGFSVFGKMLKLGLHQSIVTFSTLINGLCIVGEVAQAVRLFDDMVREGHKPNLITYNTIVNGLCKISDTNGAIRMLKIMEERRCAPHIVTYNTIIDSLCKDKHATEALKLFSEM